MPKGNDQVNSGKERKVRGNALVETIVLVGAMVSLIGGLPLLVKISDINNATIQASRYVAWERTVSDDLSARDMATEVSNRFFAKPDAKIKTGQGALTGPDNQNPFWTGFGSKDANSPGRLITAGKGVGIRFTERKAPGIAGDLSAGIVKMGKTMAKISGGKWDLEDRGLFTAVIGMDIAGNQSSFKGKNCKGEEKDDAFACVRRSNTILVDGWESKDVSEAQERERSFVLAGALKKPLKGIVEAFGAIPFFKDLGKLKSDDDGGFGYIDASIVPLDRYLEAK